jgi:hypothetical protein
VFRWRQGRLEAAPAEGADRYEPTVFERDAADRYRPVSGIERGELLRVVRDGDGEPVKLYWATYPFTRSPRPFGS